MIKEIKEHIIDNFFPLTILAIVVTFCIMSLVIIEKIENEYYQIVEERVQEMEQGKDE